MTVRFQNLPEFTHPGDALCRRIAELGDAFCVPPVIALRPGSIESRRSRQMFFEPRQNGSQVLAVLQINLVRMQECVRGTEQTVFKSRVGMAFSDDESEKPHQIVIS